MSEWLKTGRKGVGAVDWESPPKYWVALMVIAAACATVTINVDGDHVVSGSFNPSSLSAVFIALIWLPVVVKVVGLGGGTLKTPMGELQTGGIARVTEQLGVEEKRTLLPTVLSLWSYPGVQVDARAQAESRPLFDELSRQLADVTPSAGGVRETIEQFALRYEQIRTTPPSDERTRQMTTVTAEARAVARRTPLADMDLMNMLRNGSDGERVIALALAQDHPSRSLLDSLLDAVTDSRSAFEQYQALGAVLRLSPELGNTDRAKVEQALDRALRDRDGIGDDSSRLMLVEAIRDVL
jgi:hypothetical protein